MVADFDANKLGTHAFIGPEGSGFVIGVSESLSRKPAALRFAIAHELGHTDFYRWNGHGFVRQQAAGHDEELFCDQFARSLLLPLDVLVAATGRFDLLEQLAVQFGLPLLQTIVEAARVWGLQLRAARDPTGKVWTKTWGHKNSDAECPSLDLFAQAEHASILGSVQLIWETTTPH